MRSDKERSLVPWNGEFRDEALALIYPRRDTHDLSVHMNSRDVVSIARDITWRRGTIVTEEVKRSSLDYIPGPRLFGSTAPFSWQLTACSQPSALNLE